LGIIEFHRIDQSVSIRNSDGDKNENSNIVISGLLAFLLPTSGMATECIGNSLLNTDKIEFFKNNWTFSIQMMNSSSLSCNYIHNKPAIIQIIKKQLVTY
jgi:hypothetical protein